MVSTLSPFEKLIPRPLSFTAAAGSFTLAAGTRIFVDPASSELLQLAQTLADLLKPATIATLPVLPAGAASSRGGITLTTAEADPELGAEGYELKIYTDEVILRAAGPAGLFYAIQTLRQLLPPAIEKGGAGHGSLWKLPAGMVR